MATAHRGPGLPWIREAGSVTGVYWIEPPEIEATYDGVEITEGSVTPVHYSVHDGKLDSEAFDAYVNGLADDADIARLRAFFDNR